jgi:hypothetical protein
VSRWRRWYNRFKNNSQGVDYIGGCEFLLSTLMSSYNSTLSIQLLDKNNQPVHKIGAFGGAKTKDNQSKVTIRGDQLAVSRNKAIFNLVGIELSKGGLFGKDDTFVQLIKKRPDNTEFVAWQSTVVLSNQNPQWGGSKIDLANLIEGGNFDQPFIIRASRMKSGGKTEIIGEATKTVRQIGVLDVPQNQMMVNGSNIAVPISDSKGKARGTIKLVQFIVKEEFSFLDYIRAGLSFDLSLAIDFTGSNGNPTSPQSLHYIQPGCNNQYISSIRSVGSIVFGYCQQAIVNAYGFGGFVSIDGRQQDTSHCFPLSLTTSQPFCNGVEHVVQTYCQNLPRITLSGPTYFEHIIGSTEQIASRPYTSDYQHYHILLILTDGVINDMGATISKIVSAATRPMSIIIVGVGSSDWGPMSQLDGDEQRLTCPKLGPAKRDIVQFVPFMQYASDPNELARQVLAEVPAQVTEFMSMYSIRPIENRQPPPLQSQPTVAPTDPNPQPVTGYPANPIPSQQPY